MGLTKKINGDQIEVRDRFQVLFSTSNMRDADKFITDYEFEREHQNLEIKEPKTEKKPLEPVKITMRFILIGRPTYILNLIKEIELIDSKKAYPYFLFSKKAWIITHNLVDKIGDRWTMRLDCTRLATSIIFGYGNHNFKPTMKRIFLQESELTVDTQDP
jgi:hypothetical protein